MTLMDVLSSKMIFPPKNVQNDEELFRNRIYTVIMQPFHKHLFKRYPFDHIECRPDIHPCFCQSSATTMTSPLG
jgi:hypothetical protein